MVSWSTLIVTLVRFSSCTINDEAPKILITLPSTIFTTGVDVGVGVEVGVAAITVKVIAGLVIPDRAAVILALPGFTPVAKPAEDMVAIAVSDGPG